MGMDKKVIMSGDSYDATELSPQDAFIKNIDFVAFKKDLDEIGKTLLDNQGPEDLAHLNKMISWSRFCSYGGVLTCWIAVNPISIFLMSCGTVTRWAIIAHHVCHGGFDKCSDGKYNRFKFGLGSMRRFLDWLDWMLVEAWNIEHNQLHHYHLGETSDPDLVETNLSFLRTLPLPYFIKYIFVAVMACIWKWWYYAPNTFKELKANQLRRKGVEVDASLTTEACVLSPEFFIYGHPLFSAFEFFVKVLAPYFLLRFFVIPLPFFLLEHFFYTNTAYVYTTNVLISLVFAEILTNIHSFIIIVTNHAGDDLYRFKEHCTPHSATYYLRQVLSSVNFSCGGDLNDFMHGWLNYQIEHHLWPNLSMLSYQKSQPVVEALCKKHGIPYVKQNVFWRLHKLTQIMVGSSTMRKYPTAFEYKPDITSEGPSSSEGSSFD